MPKRGIKKVINRDQKFVGVAISLKSRTIYAPTVRTITNIIY